MRKQKIVLTTCPHLKKLDKTTEKNIFGPDDSNFSSGGSSDVHYVRHTRREKFY